MVISVSRFYPVILWVVLSKTAEILGHCCECSNRAPPRCLYSYTVQYSVQTTNGNIATQIILDTIALNNGQIMLSLQIYFF
jgi:hypothetical protein